VDVRLHDLIENTYSALTDNTSALSELRGCVVAAQDLFLQIVRGQTYLNEQTPALSGSVTQLRDLYHSSHPISAPSKYSRNLPRRSEQTYQKDQASPLAFRNHYYQTSLGNIEIAYGPITWFHVNRLQKPKGVAMRSNYSTPAWMHRGTLSLSAAICLLPRPRISFGLQYVAEVPWESDIFNFAMVGDFEGLVSLFRSGKAAATDMDSRGITALHVPACSF
jgi:hypothetical protein